MKEDVTRRIAQFRSSHGSLVVGRRDGSVRDLPEVVTFGESEAGALAADAIEVALAYRVEKGEALPGYTPVQDGEHAVALTARVAAKAAVYHAWREAGISKVELAQRMNRIPT